jgi:hypothetical protein
MATAGRLEERLAEIEALDGAAALGEDHVCLLRKAIGSGNGLLISKAAGLVARRMPQPFSGSRKRGSKHPQGAVQK